MYQGPIKLLHERDIARRPHYMRADLAMASALSGEPATSIVRRLVTPGDRQSSAYHRGKKPANYPVPALFVDSIGDLGLRWALWVDRDAEYLHRW